MEKHISLKDVHFDPKIMSIHELTRAVTNKITTLLISLSLNNLVEKIIVSARVGVIFQDSSGFLTSNLNTTLKISPEPYPIGMISGFGLYVNPNKLWTDGIIDIEYDQLVLRKNKILKITRGGVMFDIIDKIVIDSEILDILL